MTADPVPQSSIDLREKLREVFGFRSFRPGQRRVAEAAISGRDTVVVMPTGSGKSLCFQLPALALKGTTLVISPLIALMKDQADTLRERGIAVAELHSAIPDSEQKQAMEALNQGRLEFVYTTPERVARPDFLDAIRNLHVDLFVVDEAHCISEWGHDFRPEYRALTDAIAAVGHPPVLALTATATPEVIEDIIDRLGISGAEVVHTGFHRPNLWLGVRTVQDEAGKRAELLRLLRSWEGSGIVYTATVKAVNELAQWLEGEGLSVGAYHGRGKARDRSAIQDQFMSGEVPIIVATNAFGLGIDKADIRFVIHHHIPGTLEAYYQEAGRAGRDGLPADCVLLYQESDRALQRFFRSGRYPNVDEMSSAHNAMLRQTEAGPSIEFDDLLAITPLRKSRLQQVLQLFKDHGIASGRASGPFTLLRPDMDIDDFQRLHNRLRDREEQDKLKLQQMIEYAEIRACRWDYLVNYFGVDDVEGDSCGHCDRCAPKEV